MHVLCSNARTNLLTQPHSALGREREGKSDSLTGFLHALRKEEKLYLGRISHEGVWVAIYSFFF